ncbi:uracil-DNA glycosylase, partial [Methylobacterium radiotolerans]
MPSSTDAQADLIAYLDFHVEAGADAALDEHPHDRFSEADA